MIEKLGKSARERIAYLCCLKSDITENELRAIIGEYTSNGLLSVQSEWWGGPTGIKFPCSRVIEAYKTRLEDLRNGLLRLLGKISLSSVDHVLLAGQSSRFPTVRESLHNIGNEIGFVTDESGAMLLKECVSRGALMLADEEISITGEDRLWTRLGYVSGADFKDLIGWGTQYPVASKEIALTHDYVHQGFFDVEIFENTSLDQPLPLEKFGVFRLEVSDGAEGLFWFMLRLDEKATVRGFCRVPGETGEREMEFLP
jgi:hypothetical protein